MIILNRVADGLDGAVARSTGQTDFGGYLDLLTLYFTVRFHRRRLPIQTMQLPLVFYALASWEPQAFLGVVAAKPMQQNSMGKTFYYLGD